MDKNRIAQLIQKFRAGTATQEETDELESFWQLAKSDETLFCKLSSDEKEFIKAAMIRSIRQKIEALENPQPAQTIGTPAFSWLKIAASLALMVAIAVWWGQYGAEGGQVVQTAFGEQKSLRLPDGSTVVVNGNTTLKYAAGWNDDIDREVWINGEAFFEVIHTANNQEFIVHTDNGMDVQVLGTKFNVKSRKGKTEVMLQEGKVRLDVEKKDLSQSMTLQPGELATLEDVHFLKVRIEPLKYASWKEHKLIFDETSLREVARILEDTYGMQVVFEHEALGGRKLSGEISSADATDILKAIEETFDISVEQDGNKVTFRQ